MRDYVNIGPVPCERIARKLVRKDTESKRSKSANALSSSYAKRSAMSRKAHDWPSSGSSMTLDRTARWSAGTRQKMRKRETMRFAVRMKCR